MIFKEDNKICFTDFEYFGWDDPVKVISNFVFHEGSRGLSPENVEYFLERYGLLSDLPSITPERLNIALHLSALEWVSILLWGITPEKMSSREFSDMDFDENQYLQKQIEKIVNRVQKLKI